MSIPVTSKFKPINNGQFPVVEDVDIEGGYQVRNDTLDLNSIPSENRKEGMLVFVKSEGKYYSLESDLVTWSLADFSKSIPKKRRFNNSPQSHVASTFDNFMLGSDGINFPLYKTLQTKLGSKVNQIIYDPTEYTLGDINEMFASSVPGTLGFDISDKVGPFVWFNRLGSRDLYKYDSQQSTAKVLPLDDCLIATAKVRDAAIDPINKAMYAIGDFLGVLKIDTKDNQIDKIIFLPDQNAEILPVTPLLLAKKVLFDPVSEKVIVLPKWQSDLPSPWIWIIDKDDNVTKYDSIFNITGDSIVIGGAVIDGFLYMLTYNLNISNCNLYKVDLSTMALLETYLFDVSAGGFVPPTFTFSNMYDAGNIENAIKIVKNPNYPVVYILSAKTGPNPTDTGYVYRLNLNTGVTVPLCLNAYGNCNPLDITFDVEEDCIFVTDRGVSDAFPNILKIIDDGNNITVVDILGINIQESAPYKAIPLAIEYCTDIGTLVSDCANDKIFKINSGFTQLTEYLSVIGQSRWSVPNIRNNKILNATEIPSYNVTQEDQVLYVYNALYDGDFNKFTITLPADPVKGMTLTVKDISNIPSAAIISLGKALIEITTTNPGVLIEPSPGEYAGNSCYIVRPMISLTLNFDGDYWRIISFYTRSNGITFEAIAPPITW